MTVMEIAGRLQAWSRPAVIMDYFKDKLSPFDSYLSFLSLDQAGRPATRILIGWRRGRRRRRIVTEEVQRISASFF
jgi:hypothetical protein